jgi:hypothetical protein
MATEARVEAPYLSRGERTRRLGSSRNVWSGTEARRREKRLDEGSLGLLSGGTMGLWSKGSRFGIRGGRLFVIIVEVVGGCIVWQGVGSGIGKASLPSLSPTKTLALLLPRPPLTLLRGIEDVLHSKEGDLG